MTTRLTTLFLLLSPSIAFLFSCSSEQKKLEWRQEQNFRWAELSISSSGKTGFDLLPASKTGIDFSNGLTVEQLTQNRHLLNGSGVAVGDVDGDGLADIYFCRLNGANALYKNLGGWEFENIAEQSGVTCSEDFSTGATFADLDGDDDLDLLVTTLGGPNYCFLNDGTGKFSDATAASGLFGDSGATTMALADVDGDNDLDLYVANYKKRTVKDQYIPRRIAFDNVVRQMRSGAFEIDAEFKEHYELGYLNDEVLTRYEVAEPDMLYLNDGNGRFTPVSFTDGRFLDENGERITDRKDWGLTARFQDFDQDGDPDIYVCNDFESPDHAWINDGAGNFRAMPKLAMRNTSWATMGVDFSDIDRDGDLDFLLLDMLSRDHRLRKRQRYHRVPLPHSVGVIDDRPQYSRNTLFLNRGDDTYTEIAQFSGVAASDWSWSPFFLDVDLDGFEDIVIGTGHYHDALDENTLKKLGTRAYSSLSTWQKQILEYPDLKLPNAAFRNRGDLTFEDVTTDWGLDSKDVTHGMALGDFDNDGDLDLVANRLDTTAAVYRNRASEPRIAVRLKGLPPNTRGVGSQIRVSGGPVLQSKEVIAGGAYLSSSDQIYMFAAADLDRGLTIEVKWRSGATSVIRNAKGNRIYEIHETGATRAADDPVQSPKASKPYFENVSEALDHIHHEEPWDDFQQQVLLPKKLSQLGPGLVWHDLDNDGFDDLLIGGGRDGSLAGFRNDGNGGFEQFSGGVFSEKNVGDQNGLIIWRDQTKTPRLWVSQSNLESMQPEKSSIAQFVFQNGQFKPASKISFGASNPGALTMADYDLDGDLDLFAGGRSVPMRFPEAASSKLYRNENGVFLPDSANNSNFAHVGMVSSAIFSDYDGDGDSDLILAIEWGPITIFRNDDGVFADATHELGLTDYHGWWQGVATGDFDEDGALDIIATNWGLNSKYEHRYSKKHPLRLYFNDFDNNSSLDLFETVYTPELGAYAPENELFWLQMAMPDLRRRFTDYSVYSHSGIEDVIGPKFDKAQELQASFLAHAVFINQGDRFEAKPLPAEAQFAPAFYAGVADYDGDGHDDVFLSQNFFAQRVESSRSDAGRGLWLKGDGSGGLAAVPGQDSGIKIYGEQRGAALSDYNKDGRVDLAVSQNGAETKLYKNAGAKPGLRVKLAGPPGNPSGIGALVRIVYENGLGPAREVQSGSGYWSQNSDVHVLGLRDGAKGIQVRWPGGKITQKNISSGTEEVVVRFTGK